MTTIKLILNQMNQEKTDGQIKMSLQNQTRIQLILGEKNLLLIFHKTNLQKLKKYHGHHLKNQKRILPI